MGARSILGGETWLPQSWLRCRRSRPDSQRFMNSRQSMASAGPLVYRSQLVRFREGGPVLSVPALPTHARQTGNRGRSRVVTKYRSICEHRSSVWAIVSPHLNSAGARQASTSFVHKRSFFCARKTAESVSGAGCDGIAIYSCPHRLQAQRNELSRQIGSACRNHEKLSSLQHVCHRGGGYVSR